MGGKNSYFQPSSATFIGVEDNLSRDSSDISK